MPDKIELRFGKNVADQVVEHFISYHIDADLFIPADKFQFELSNPEIKIKRGMRCEVWVNEKKEMTGLVDVIHRKVNKRGVSLAVEGRDLMGLLVDSHCEKLMTVSGKKLKELAEILLATVPFINRKEIIYQENIAGTLRKKRKAKASGGLLFNLDVPQKISQIEVGMTIFQVLKQVAMSRGMLFYSLPDGTFVFGRPMTKGEPTYTLQILKSGKGNNVIEAEYIDDISKRYSKVIIKGQQQGQDSHGLFPAKVNTGDSVVDDEFPFYKPFMTKNNYDSLSPKMYARLILEKQRREGMQSIYKVARHSQNGTNWTINKMCRVVDDVNDTNGVYLIYGRTFELSKQDGPTTKLKLGEPGRVE